MNYVLLTIDKDWADEFSCEAFVVLGETAWNSKVAKARKQGRWDYYFGTNEGWEEIFFDDWIKDIKVKSISEEEANSLVKLFDLKRLYCYGQGYGFGTAAGYITPEFFCEHEEDDEEFREGDDL